MLALKKRNPLQYHQCNQTVTIYHKDDNGYRKTVYNQAFLEFKKTQNVDKTGSREANTFLLVIPCDEQCVFVGDKVLLGEGKEISDRETWANFIPANVSGLVVVSYVDPKYYHGKLVHVEAGG